MSVKVPEHMYEWVLFSATGWLDRDFNVHEFESYDQCVRHRKFLRTVRKLIEKGTVIRAVEVVKLKNGWSPYNEIR